MTRRYDESLAAIQEMQQAGTAVYRVDDMEFGRRLAVDRELELPGPDGRVPGRWINAIWDESGNFVIYPTLLGIKGSYKYFCMVVSLLSSWFSIVDSFYSRQSCNEPCCETPRERRDSTMVKFEFIPRCTCEERVYNCCMSHFRGSSI